MLFSCILEGAEMEAFWKACSFVGAVGALVGGFFFYFFFVFDATSLYYAVSM